MKMKKTFLLAIAIGLAIAVLPAVAGEDNEYEKQCGADAQTCLNWFAEHYKDRGWAGVSLEKSDYRLRVSEVHAGTPAAKAGVKVGDVLVAINGVEYNEANKEAMAELEKLMVPGQEFTYTISRNDKNRDISFALAEMPMDVLFGMLDSHVSRAETSLDDLFGL